MKAAGLGRLLRRRRTPCDAGVASGSPGQLDGELGPLADRLVTAIWPPIDWTRCLTIERPRPVPPSSRLRALSTR